MKNIARPLRTYRVVVGGQARPSRAARQEWARARAINPRYSQRQKGAVLPYRDPAVLDRMAEGLAKAGIDPDAVDGEI